MKFTTVLSISSFGVAAHALAIQSPLSTPANSSCPAPKVKYEKRYTGTSFNTGTEARLRISNGGAGQSGLVGALASAYIDYSRSTGSVQEDYAIDWVVGDTTESIYYLETGEADIAITYTAAAENRAMSLGVATKRVYGFRDHFYLVGPKANPARLSEWNDSVFDMFNKIVTTGNNGTGTPPTRFLSRYDKSATNIKEALIFAQIGQVPWAYPYSKWYHQYPQYPNAALIASSLLSEYTLTDRGTYLTLQSQSPDITDASYLYLRGEDRDPQDALLNPASVLLGAKVCEKNKKLADGFVEWMVSKTGGQKVVANFEKAGTTGKLYTAAPDCKIQPTHCVGW